MKNLMIMAIGIAVFSVSCNRETTIDEELPKELVENIIDATQSYISNQKEINTVRATDWGAILAADAGGYIISTFQGNSGSDRVIDALATSAKAYFSGISNGPPNDFSDVGLAANPYDFVGKYHVEILDFIVNEPTGAFINSNDLDFEACLSYANSVFTSNGYPQYSNTASHLQQSVGSSMNAIQQANYLVSNLIIGQSNADIVLKSYFLALESTNNVGDFINYSINVETSIINSQQFNSNEKKYLLSNMATARHDVNYWGG